MRKSKRDIPGFKDWIELNSKKYSPKESSQLEAALKILKRKTKRTLNSAEAEYAEFLINGAVDEFLRQRATEDAMPTSAAQVRSIRRQRLQIEVLLKSLASAKWDVVLAVSRRRRNFYDDLLIMLQKAVTNLQESEAVEGGGSTSGREESDPKVTLLSYCRHIMFIFSGKHPGFTKEGPLAEFARAVLKYATGEDGSFDRQIRKLPTYEREVAQLTGDE